MRIEDRPLRPRPPFPREGGKADQADGKKGETSIESE